MHHIRPTFEHVSKAPFFCPFHREISTQLLTRLQASKLEIWLSAVEGYYPLAVNPASQFADYTAQKRRQKPSELGDACKYLEYSKHDTVAEHEEQYKYLHTTYVLFM